MKEQTPEQTTTPDEQPAESSQADSLQSDVEWPSVEAPPRTKDPRGRDATRPHEIPARGWLDIGARVWTELGADNVSLVAAGVAMLAMLAAFPALAALVSIFGLFADPTQIGGLMQPLMAALPTDVVTLVDEHLSSISERDETTLGVGAAVGLLLALWSARKGMSALISACSIAYEEPRRSWLATLIYSVAFTLAAILGFVFVLSLGIAMPVAVETLRIPEWAQNAVALLRWPMLWLVAVGGLSVIYRYAPNRRRAQWPWVRWGAVWAGTVWLLGSMAFSYYVTAWASYAETYGAVGGVVVMLLWFYLTSFVIILGAEINAEIEHQTAVDTTVGEPKPLGERGAYVADSVGRAFREKPPA